MRFPVCVCALLFVRRILALAADSTNNPAALDAAFHKVMIATNTADPMELAVTPDSQVVRLEYHAGSD